MVEDLSAIQIFHSFVRLSLLTMTNLNQMREVLLFVCSKMDGEANLISKLPVADRKREVWGRKLCWWRLSSGFPLRTFLFGFADSFCFVFTSTPSYEASPLCLILCKLFPWLYWYVEVLREALRVSLYRFASCHMKQILDAHLFCIFSSVGAPFAMSSAKRNPSSTSAITLDLACNLLKFKNFPSKRYLIGIPFSPSCKASVSIAENIMLNSVEASTQPCLTLFVTGNG